GAAGHVQLETQAGHAAEAGRTQARGFDVGPAALAQAVHHQVAQFVRAGAGAIPGAVRARAPFLALQEDVFARLDAGDDDQPVQGRAVDGPGLDALVAADARPVQVGLQFQLVDLHGAGRRLQPAAGAG